ncbi:MAG: hypothetical protein IOC35_02850 [Methylobacterium sp.]|jgi:hypothetical protein|nr:hypothetical protein [Methylobacterium sp.]
MNSPRATLLILLALGIALVLAVSGGLPSLSGDDMASLVSFGILLTMMATWGLAEIRGNMGESLRNLLIWGVVVLILVFGYQNKAMLGFSS